MLISSFIYGRRRLHFPNVPFALKVFHFSYVWGLELLQEKVDQFLKKCDVPEIWPIFDLFVSLQNQIGLAWTKAVKHFDK
jgi:hypothetical protein